MRKAEEEAERAREEEERKEREAEEASRRWEVQRVILEARGTIPPSGFLL